MTRLLIIFLLIFLIASLRLSSRIHYENFRLCANGQLNGIDNLLNIHGYFMKDSAVGTEPSAILVYKDGSFGNLWISFDSSYKIEDYFVRRYPPHKLKHSALRWGRYELVKDTIKAQWFGMREAFDYRVVEECYVVKDRNTIQRVMISCPLCPPRDSTNKISYDVPPVTYHFVPFAAKPDSINWLTKKKWYRCH